MCGHRVERVWYAPREGCLGDDAVCASAASAALLVGRWLLHRGILSLRCDCREEGGDGSEGVHC